MDSRAPTPLRTALICHDDNAISREVLPAFLASFSELVGIVVINEPRGRLLERLRVEIRRSRLRTIDVFAFRLWYRLRGAGRDREWLLRQREQLAAAYGPAPGGSGYSKRRIPTPTLRADSSKSARRMWFSHAARPCCNGAYSTCRAVARSSSTRASVRSIATHTVASGRSRKEIGTTSARRFCCIDEGIDTGPALAYYYTDVDESTESHVMIQHRVVFDNLDRIAEDIARHSRGELEPIDTSGRPSQTWGQPRLSDWLRWNRAARRSRRAP